SAGRVPSWPAFNVWYPLSVVGPMARTVRDVALQLVATAGPDSRVPISIEEPASIFAQPLERSLQGIRIAWSRDFVGLPVEPSVTRVLDAQRHVFEELGMIVEDADPDLSGADEVFKVLRAHHFALSYGPLLKSGRAHMKDTVVWNIEQGLQLTGPQIGRAERE